ncbi:MAG TPA: chemotaxis protein CheA [Chloroflexota bacterium]|jgi:two-component system chemotaxis sensor kinase CheA
MMKLHLDATPEELHVFLAETSELLDGLDAQLVRLEQEGPSASLLQEVFRAAHTIKGSAAALGHTRLARLTHAWETLLDKLRHGELAVSPALLDRFFEALDVLKALAGEVESGGQTATEVESLAAALEAWADGEAPAPEAPPARPARAIRPTTLPAPDGATHHVLLGFAPGDWTAVRALQALLALEGAADVLVSQPTRADVEQGIVKERLEMWLRSDHDSAALRALLGDLDETMVLSLTLAEEMGAETAEIDWSAPAPPRGAATPTADGARPGGAGGGSTTVRIDVERLDNLLNLVGELVIDRTRLLELGRSLSEELGDHRLLAELHETTQHLERISDELQAEVMKSRMLPIGTVFGRLPRVVRDLASRLDKRVELVVEGQETELDRSVIEEIGDPLVHLLRNAVDHGVEAPAERLARGKPETARVRLAAEHVENSIVIVVEDDGAGIDAARMRQTAVARGILTAEAAARLSEQEAIALVFAPGFSTAREVTDVSGRGVGMDIVRANVERLGGSVDVQTALRAGTRFVLRLPLTLAIVQALLVRVAGAVHALPISAVTETLRVPAREVQRLQGQEAVLLRGRVVPLVRLSAVFGEGVAPSANSDNVLIVAVRLGERQIGLVVDALLGEQEVVIKALGPIVGPVPGISSAAILGDGTVVLIVDVPGLVQQAAAGHLERGWADSGEPAVPALAVN